MKIGIIGYGSIGRTHAKNLSRMGHNVIAYDPVIWPDGELEACVKRADAIVIASPSDTHGTMMAQCAGKPMLVEKPIATSVGYDLAKMVVDSGQLVMMGNNMRYHPVFREAQKHIKEIGKLFIADFALLQKNTKYNDPVVLNWGAHETDMALSLFGSAAVTGIVTTAKLESAEFLLAYKDHRQLTSHIKLDYTTEPWVREMHLIGQFGYICADFEKWTVEAHTKRAAEIISVPGTHNDSYVAEMDEFIRRVEGKEPDDIGATGKDGLRCLDLLLDVMRRAQ